MANESQVLKIVTGTPGKRPTATVSLVDENGDPIDLGGGGEGSTVAWDDVEDKPAVIAAGADQAEARGAIGLGTGSIVNADIGASAAIALSKLANVAAGTDGLGAGTLQATLQALATRIQGLEDAE